MHTLTLDTALNLLWVAIGVFALAALAVAERRSRRQSTRRARCQRLAAVLLVSVSLFPAVSYSDDLFSFSLLQTHFGHHDGVGSTPPEDPSEKTSSVQLARLLESLHHLQISAFCAVAFFLCCLATVFFVRVASTTRPVLCRSGRAPPSA